MDFYKKTKKILYGGDYNPEQWNEDIWKQDMKLLKDAGIDIVTLNVFNWAMLQPDEITYNLEELDRTVEFVTKEGMLICMATSTGAHPAWMAKKYPDILRTGFNGMKRKFGGRHNSCPNSPTFRKYSVQLAQKLAKHYSTQENIIVWHVSNEYEGACYCENCEKAFRVWLRKKYGTLEHLNKEWSTHFWGHTFYDWDEIVAPNLLSEHFEETRSMYQSITLDYMRFNSESMYWNYMDESKVIKSQIPNAVVTTNFMGAYKPLDYHKWAEHIDIISWDNYPAVGAAPAAAAMNHDLMRGLKQGKPFMLMEQTPSVCNWLTDNRLKRPGIMRLLSYQAVAHGADTVMFFQMRRSPAGCEKFHGGVIDHVGNGYTRVYKECAVLGKELRLLGDEILDTRVNAKAAIIFDWETWWALECSAGPSTRLKYIEEFQNYYKALHGLHLSVDIIGLNDEFSKYRLIVAPLLYMIKDEVDIKLKAFVQNGGSVVITYLSGYVNENDYITVGGYPGKLRELAGIWVEEIDSLPEQAGNSFIYKDKTYPAVLLCDVIHGEGAETIAEYQEDFYAHTPVITKNTYGSGYVYYIGTRSSEKFYQEFFIELCEGCGLKSASENEVRKAAAMSEEGIEITSREKDDMKYVFILNHSNNAKEISIAATGIDLLTGKQVKSGETLIIEATDVYIIKLEQ